MTFETSDTQLHDQLGASVLTSGLWGRDPVVDAAPEIMERREQLRARPDPMCFPLAQSCFLAWEPNHSSCSTLLMAHDIILGIPYTCYLA